MPTTKFDLIQGAEAEITSDTTRVLRRARVKDIDMSVPSLALLNVVNTPGFPAMRSPIDPTKTWLILLRVRIVGMSEKKGWVDVELEYGREDSEFIPTVYVVTDDTYVTHVTSPKIPGLAETIACSFDATGGIAAADRDVIMGTFFRPARAMNVTALRYGRPAGGFQAKVGMVNDDEWPEANVNVPSGLPGAGESAWITTNSADPLPQAYWMLGRYRTQWNRQGFATIEAQTISKTFEDWSEYFFVQNTQGKRPFGALTIPQQNALLQAAFDKDYRHGYIYGEAAGEQGKGLVRIGPYPMVGFFGLFGF